MKNHKVLLIDDDPIMLRQLTAFLQDLESIEIMTALTGENGLEAVRLHRPSLVVLDLGLPQMSGEEVLQAIKSDPSRAAPLSYARLT